MYVIIESHLDKLINIFPIGSWDIPETDSVQTVFFKFDKLIKFELI